MADDGEQLLMEDLTTFADFLEFDNLGQQGSEIHGFSDYGHLYKYSDNHDVFSAWDDAFSRQWTETSLPNPPQTNAARESQKQDVELEGLASANLEVDRSEIFFRQSGEIESQNLRTVGDSEGARIFSQDEACAHCGQGAFYCSAGCPSHKASCREGDSQAAASDKTFFARQPFPQRDSHHFESPDMDPLQSDMFHPDMFKLLDWFEEVQDSVSITKKRGLLQRCVCLCEKIIEQGNPTRAPLPQVVSMLDEAKAMLRVYGKEGEGDVSASNNASRTERYPASGRSFRDMLQADVKEALDRVDNEEQETSGLSEVPEEDQEVEGVYIRKGMWHCVTHKLELCSECNVDHRLFNQVRRSGTEGTQVDADVLHKEQQRLQGLELQATVPPYPDPVIPDESTQVQDHQDLQDYDSIAKELNKELARAREKEEAEFLKYFSSFHLSEE